MRLANVGGSKWGMRVEEAGRTHVQYEAISRIVVVPKPLRAMRVEEYARNVQEELAEGRIAQINKAGRNIHFAWSGGINRGDPHYYRVQTASFLIELDDTQDDANHIHSVWRDFTDDFRSS